CIFGFLSKLTACVLLMQGTHRRLAQWRVTWLIEHSTSHQLLWCIDSFVLRNPPLRQAPKRYKLCQRRLKKLTQYIEMIRIEKYNESKAIKGIIYACISLVILFAGATFAQYYSTKLNLTNPLIPEDLVQMSLKPYLIKGIILVSGLVGVFALTFYKRNILALVLAIILIVYYLFSNHYIGVGIHEFSKRHSL
ncbi:hypothetical protein, partial [Flavobacterium macacae]|uniref:hypothetical protein n=1 Tax=Flavobacterium macacae TaxID=2488993 RepID=UPI0013157C9B